jgi:hypothetical protein
MVMIKNAIQASIVVMMATAAIKLNDKLLELKVGWLHALIAAVVIAVIIKTALEKALIDLPMRFRWSRGFLDPVSEIEGHWFEEVSDQEAPYSYACIEFDPQKRKYSYYGCSFSKDFNLEANFKSTSVDVIREDSTIHFRFEAGLLRTNNEDMSISGYGDINFFKDGSNTIQRGEGKFVQEEGSELIKRRIILTKIPKEFIVETLHKKGAASAADIKKMVKEWAQKNDMLLIKT